MPQTAREYSNYYYQGNYRRTCTAIPRTNYGHNLYEPKHSKVSYIRKKRNPKVQKNRAIARFVAVLFFLFLGIFILPVAFKNVTIPLFVKTPYKNIQVSSDKLLFPTMKYLNNSMMFGKYLFSNAVSAKNATMAELTEGEEMTTLEKQIINILPQYQSIEPSVFVWDYDTGNFADINADEIYSAASIIKIPVLISLFKTLETGAVNLSETMILKDYYRAEGSGGLQYKAEDSIHSIDELARIMITDSDNSSTNMLMSRIGSMVAVNRNIRSWGLNKTSLRTWLPDLDGTNHTTARDLARMLYNIENPNFLSESSRYKIADYMGHVKNNRLIQAGLGQDAAFIHKTGDIGKMLGDAGIVTLPNGKKYIVVIMVNRPYNSTVGKDFIVKASELIYNYMITK